MKATEYDAGHLEIKSKMVSSNDTSWKYWDFILMSVFIQVNQRNGSRKRSTVGSSHNEVAPSDKITTQNKSQ